MIEGLKEEYEKTTKELNEKRIELVKLLNLEEKITIDDKTARELGFNDRQAYIEYYVKMMAERIRVSSIRIINGNKIKIIHSFGIFSDSAIYSVKDMQKFKELLEEIKKLEDREVELRRILVEHRPIE